MDRSNKRMGVKDNLQQGLVTEKIGRSSLQKIVCVSRLPRFNRSPGSLGSKLPSLTLLMPERASACPGKRILNLNYESRR
ncbi:Protein Mgarp [Manis pentadactyla]|nr:Protein Mgarp [Manis pentadactyla]